MTNQETKQKINSILRECILNESDKSKIKMLFQELMQDKAAWDKFLRIVVPSLSKDLDVVTNEEFETFKKITFEEIDNWKPKG